MGTNKAGSRLKEKKKLHSRHMEQLRRNLERRMVGGFRNFIPIDMIKIRPCVPYKNPHTGEVKKDGNSYKIEVRDSNMSCLEKDIASNGLKEELVIDSENYLVDGYQRLRILRKLGIRRIPVSRK